jgi:hypothetical protein
LVYLLLVASVSIGPTPGQAAAQELSGTIRYTGSRVVSDSQPISVYLLAFGPPLALLDIAYVSVNGGAFALHASAPGGYALFYSLDIHDYRDESSSVGAPFEVYNDCYHFSLAPPEMPPCADLITVPQAGVTLEFGDTAILSGIAGTVTYTGAQHVTPGNSLDVEAFSNPQFSGEPDLTFDYAERNGRYELITLGAGKSYYLRAFLDLNSNRQLDPGEPFGACSNAVVAGADQTGVTISFGDDGAATCIVPSPPTPTPTVTPSPSTVSLSGSILYTGTHGPVSSTRRILVFLTNTPSLSSETTLFLKAKVSTNPGTFSFDVPAAGDYYLLYSLDEHNTGSLNVGTPFAAYNSRCDFPADPIAAPQSNVQVQFGDTCFPSGIAGNMTYTGSLGSVSAGQRLCLQAFADADLLTNGWLGPPCGANEQNNGEGYDLPTFDTRTYYPRAFLDVNGNRALDAGEPFQVYSNKSRAPADPVVASTTQTDINFTFGDENVVPSACVGDCSNDRSVTVDELLTMVNIALGNADISACDAGDANHDGQITIDEILTAVNNALNGCS